LYTPYFARFEIFTALQITIIILEEFAVLASGPFQTRVANHFITLILIYSRINSTKSPTSDASKISEPRLMSQFERLREVVCFCSHSGGDASVLFQT